MGRELKRETAPATPAVALAVPEPALRALSFPSAHAGQRLPRWFAAAHERSSRPRARQRPRALLLAGMALLALIAVAFTRSLVLRALLPIALACAAIVIVLRGRSARKAAPPSRRTQRGLALELDRLAFHATDRTSHTLLKTAEPFGVTLVATRRRDRLALALTSSDGTFFVGSAFDAASRRAHAALLARASTVGSEEVVLDAIGPDGAPLTLAPNEIAALVDALAVVDPAAQDRFVLSDARGAPIVLDGQELRIQDRRFDLGAPLEWRAIVFQEAFGNAVAIYQGTWVRQGSAEVVLVSLLSSIGPSSAPSDIESTGVLELDRAALRDMRLMQATPDDPPPTEQRVALDRVFMFPLRSALDRAPRPSSQPARASA